MESDRSTNKFGCKDPGVQPHNRIGMACADPGGVAQTVWRGGRWWHQGYYLNHSYWGCLWPSTCQTLHPSHLTVPT